MYLYHPQVTKFIISVVWHNSVNHLWVTILYTQIPMLCYGEGRVDVAQLPFTGYLLCARLQVWRWGYDGQKTTHPPSYLNNNSNIEYLLYTWHSFKHFVCFSFLILTTLLLISFYQWGNRSTGKLRGSRHPGSQRQEVAELGLKARQSESLNTPTIWGSRY